MKQLKSFCRNRLARLGAFVTAGLAGASAHAQTELPAGVSTLFSDITSQIEALFALMWPVILLVVGTFVLVKITKKVVNKAT